MIDQLPLFLGLSMILTHELDAVQRREWRIFPLLSRLSDNVGFVVFTAVHVPLFLVVLWALFSSGLNRQVANGFSLFLVIHVGLHLLALLHPHNEFRSPLSWALIGGAGLCGALDLLLNR